MIYCFLIDKTKSPCEHAVVCALTDLDAGKVSREWLAGRPGAHVALVVEGHRLPQLESDLTLFVARMGGPELFDPLI